MLNNYVPKQTLVAIALLATPALADPPHTRAGLLAAFGDWRLDCAVAPCRTYTRIVAAGGTEVLRLAVAGDEPRALAVVTPLPLHLPGGLALAFGPGPERSDPWRTCGAVGCEATLPLDAELLAALRRERTGAVTFTLADGERVRLGFSLMGFSAALRALDAAPVSRPP